MNKPNRASRHQPMRWSCVFIESRHQVSSGASRAGISKSVEGGTGEGAAVPEPIPTAVAEAGAGLSSTTDALMYTFQAETTVLTYVRIAELSTVCRSFSNDLRETVTIPTLRGLQRLAMRVAPPDHQAGPLNRSKIIRFLTSR